MPLAELLSAITAISPYGSALRTLVDFLRPSVLLTLRAFCAVPFRSEPQSINTPLVSQETNPLRGEYRTRDLPL